jgi:hypothetical protein
MARGFESKSVEAQQEEAARRSSSTAAPEMTPEARNVEQRRRALALTRAHVQHDLDRATAPAHRAMLQEALTTLDKQLSEL